MEKILSQMTLVLYSVSPERVRNWIKVGVGLLEFADSNDSSKKEDLLKDRIETTDKITPEQVLSLLELPEQASFYHTRIGKFGEGIGGQKRQAA